MVLRVHFMQNQCGHLVGNRISLCLRSLQTQQSSVILRNSNLPNPDMAQLTQDVRPPHTVDESLHKIQNVDILEVGSSLRTLNPEIVRQNQCLFGSNTFLHTIAVQLF